MARTKAFDRDVALDRAMHVFWGKGYEATSLQELVEAMGFPPGRRAACSRFGAQESSALTTRTVNGG